MLRGSPDDAAPRVREHRGRGGVSVCGTASRSSPSASWRSRSWQASPAAAAAARGPVARDPRCRVDDRPSGRAWLEFGPARPRPRRPAASSVRPALVELVRVILLDALRAEQEMVDRLGEVATHRDRAARPAPELVGIPWSLSPALRTGETRQRCAHGHLRLLDLTLQPFTGRTRPESKAPHLAASAATFASPSRGRCRSAYRWHEGHRHLRAAEVEGRT